MRRALLLFAAVLASHQLSAQATTPAKEFEVVSVRPVEELSTEEMVATAASRRVRESPDTIRMPYETMVQVLERAFGMARTQVVAPDWTESQHFSIAAKLPAGATQDDVPEMLRSMLAARFHMAYHREVRTTSALVLTLSKSGIKAEKTAAVDPRPHARPIANGGMHYEPAMTSAALSDLLKRLTLLPVVDKTGLLDAYLLSFDVYPFGRFDADGKSTDPPSGDFFAYEARHWDEALAPLGLHLNLSKADLDNVIIDHLDRQPTEN